MIEIKVTQDGSSTLYLTELDEHYHSTYGAVQESQHVFVGAGFEQCTSTAITVLEIGFGTGLNCLLTLLAGSKDGKDIRYFAVEKFPISAQVWRQLNYGELTAEADHELFSLLHTTPWNMDASINDHFVLHKMEADVRQIDWSALSLTDLVYFDAFSPDKQPELWERPIFEMLFGIMKEGGVLVTYCAKGLVRRTLQSVGFQVERIPGPPGKREMLRARKKLE